jgi:hypothetical protein
MQAICEQVLKLVRAERGLTGKPAELANTEVVA